MDNRGKEVTIFNINSETKNEVTQSLKRKNGHLMVKAKNHNNIGVDYKKKGELVKAISHITKAFDLAKIAIIDEDCKDNFISLILFNRGKAYAAKGDFDETISDFNLALDYFNADLVTECLTVAEIYYQRGGIYEKQGKYNEALKDYTKALEFDSIINILKSDNIEQIKKSDLFNAIKILPDEEKISYLQISSDKKTSLNKRFNKIEGIFENIFQNNFQKEIQQELDKCLVNQKRFDIN